MNNLFGSITKIDLLVWFRDYRSKITEIVFWVVLFFFLGLSLYVGWIITNPPLDVSGERIKSVDIAYNLDERLAKSYEQVFDKNIRSPNLTKLNDYLLVREYAFWSMASKNPEYQQYVLVEREDEHYVVHYLLQGASAAYSVEIEQTVIDLSNSRMNYGHYIPNYNEEPVLVKQDGGTDYVKVKLIWHRAEWAVLCSVILFGLFFIIVQTYLAGPALKKLFEHLKFKLWLIDNKEI